MKKFIKVMSIILVIALTAGIALSLMACKLDPSKHFVVATNAEFAPFEYMEGKEFKGIDIDIAQIFADKLGQKLVIKNMDFDGVVTSVGTNGVDVAMAGLSVNEERKKSVNFTEPYFESTQKLIVKTDDTTFDDIEQMEADKQVEAVEEKIASLGNVKIGIQIGTISGLYLKGDKLMEYDGFENVEVKGYANIGMAAKELINGNVKAVLADDAPADTLVNSEEFKGKIKIVNVSLIDDIYAFGVDKGQPELLKTLNEIIKELKENGKLKEIIDSYIQK